MIYVTKRVFLDNKGHRFSLDKRENDKCFILTSQLNSLSSFFPRQTKTATPNSDTITLFHLILHDKKKVFTTYSRLADNTTEREKIFDHLFNITLKSWKDIIRNCRITESLYFP